MATTPSALDTSTNTDTDITTATTTTKLYEYIASYNFSSDLEFRKGLGTILGHPETPVSDSELLKEDDNVVLQAKCFYISRKKNVSPPIDAASFRNWLIENNKTSAATAASHAQQQQQQQESEQTLPSSSSQSKTTSGKDAEPAYPSSFSHIVELITTGQPIPGIEEIPDTVLSGHDQPSKAERRRKPWEKAEEESGS